MSDTTQAEVERLTAQVRAISERLHKAEHAAAKMTGRWQDANGAWREDWLPRLKAQAALLAEARAYVAPISACEDAYGCGHARCELLQRIDDALAQARDDRHLPESTP